MASSDGQTLFTAAEDSSIFIFNIVQPHQMVIAAPVALALSREEQSFLIERESFEEKQDNMTRLREVYNLHRSQFQCARTKLSEHQTRDIVQQKNKWQMTLSSLRKQAHALSKQKAEQEKKASEIIADCDKQHAEKIRAVKELYESKLTEQTQQAADLMKEKIRIQCEYEDKLHQMAEEYKGQLKERRLTAQHDLESRAKGNVDAEKEFRQIERLQDEEKIVLQQEHKLEMEKFIQKYEERIAERNNRIEAVRTDLVGHQDIYDGHVETKQSHLAAISKINSENQQLEKRKQFLRDQIAQLKVELAARGERVAEQTNHLLELKGLNDELQKHRTVLDHHATVLKKELDPKDSEIEQLREKISENGSELRKLKISNAKDMAELEEKEQRINTLYNDILQAEGQSQRCEAKISQFKNKVHSIYTDVDPDGWPAELAKLHSEFVTHDEIEQEDQALRDALEEFETHKSALADKVVELRMKVEGDTESSGSRFIKQIGKNEELMIDLGRLRSENQKLKADLHLAQTELNALLRQCTRESKQLADKVKIMFRSTNLVQPVQGQVQRKMTREGVSMTVEQFHS
jgi:chromosome segregation ATPase